jgi:adenylate kinase
MARKTILITGVPGTGKTTLARGLAKKTKAALIDINKLVEVLRLYSFIDKRDNAKVVHLRELERELAAAIKSEKRSVIVEGHLGCEMELPVQSVLVLRCNPKTLRARLSGRNYPPEKVAENSMAEALDYCTIVSEKKYGNRKVRELDTTELSEKQVLDSALKAWNGKAGKKQRVSFPDALLQEAISGDKIRKALG